MTFPEWANPGLYGAMGGAIAVSILGFTWGSWMTNNSAETMARDMASAEVTLAMVPICLNMSTADPERIEKLAVLQEISGFGRRNPMMETGWATRPGSDAPDRDLAEACFARLELDGS